MAGSRVEKVGSIFARMHGMLKTRVIPLEDKPVWFDIYALHPPYDEPRYDREGSLNEVRDILYKEDVIRAKFHDRVKRIETINMSDKGESKTQKFIKLYSDLSAQGALDEQQIFEVALEQYQTGGKPQIEHLVDEVDEFDGIDPDNVEEIEEKKSDEAVPQKKPVKDVIDIKNLF